MAMRDATDFAAGGVHPARGAEWIHHYLRTGVNLEKGIAPFASIAVYINHGRWIAECPDCHGAQLACRTDHRFLCNDCGNIAVEGLWRPVDWPANPGAIEEALDMRPLANQNWVPGQTVDDLLAEEIAHRERG